ncbi:MAG: helix-turn-helix transcriptional regulator [Rhodospirillaceae bacterium]|nr:helix-turn-helix transcriptional regulator [Rhodospirillaceae bacterium]MBT5415785.1 helix-turn-helix transcriptional regulator [Rhodospirillaceae bacterium]MBT6119468.1 helix-turn-helix transcriptional regulator [Rhodospirillaceae bacterium]
MQKTDDHSFRSHCSIARTLELVGDKWTLLVVRDLLWHGKHTFQALQGSAERIPTNMLAERLRRLMSWGLVRREPYQDRPVRYGYYLTEAGWALEPVLLQVMQWGHRHLDGDWYDPEKSGRNGDSEWD